MSHATRYPIQCLSYKLLKKKTLASRGSGTRRRVLGHLKVLKDWKSFLRHNDNKTELFEYLAYYNKNLCPVDKMVIVTSGENVSGPKGWYLKNNLYMLRSIYGINTCNITFDKPYKPASKLTSSILLSLMYTYPSS